MTSLFFICAIALIPFAFSASAGDSSASLRMLLLGAALWQLFVPDRPGVPWRDYHPLHWSDWRSAIASLATQIVLSLIGLGLFAATVLWVLYAAVSGRKIKQRLTDPEPIGEMTNDQIPMTNK